MRDAKKKNKKNSWSDQKALKKFKLIRCREMNERTFQHPARYVGCIYFYNNAIISLWNLPEQNSGLEFIKLGSSIFCDRLLFDIILANIV